MEQYGKQLQQAVDSGTMTKDEARKAYDDARAQGQKAIEEQKRWRNLDREIQEEQNRVDADAKRKQWAENAGREYVSDADRAAARASRIDKIRQVQDEMTRKNPRPEVLYPDSKKQASQATEDRRNNRPSMGV
jgi:hypothetical protein